jgi:hypothetical protein
MSTTAPELFTTLSTGWADAVQQWLDQSQRMWDQLGAPLREAGPSTPERHHHRGCECHEGHRGHHDHEHDHHYEHGHGCHCHHGDHGGHDDCCRDACDCCVPEADVVVHARVGERRVVPFRLRNSWRREREVTLAVGPWHLCAGEGLVVVAVLEAEKVVLKPCEDRIIRLGLAVMVESDDSGDKEEPNVGRTEVTHRFTRDLEACASAYADLRFEGCARPQRIAVVVSPTECDAVDVACDCGCC